MRLFDAHNHAQDERLAPVADSLWPAVRQAGLARMVVNGSAESDWDAVALLAEQHPEVIPAFGYHPWYVRERRSGWRENLVRHLDRMPSTVGEIGLDRWIKDPHFEQQEEMFVWQLQLAAERNLPVSIHCLQAWGKLLEILEGCAVPQCGFLLHSFGGPAEMVRPLTELGAYFSLPGYYAHERKARQRETFLTIPPDRLLIETDAPDQSLPEHLVEFPVPVPEGEKPLNHPANISAVYRFAAELYGEPLSALGERVERNFRRLFAGFVEDRGSGEQRP